MAREAQETAGIHVPPPLIYLVPLLAGLGLRRALPGIPLPRAIRRALGALLLGSGVALNGWFITTMLAAKTPINPTRPVSALVTQGPFQLSRNPSYLSMAGMYAGLSLLANSLVSLLLLPAILQLITRAVIEREEAYLLRRFGREYADYQARVRRWL
jgi:protein-S-isoprenylcysteine O-methyltransferase Ste14